MAKRQAVYERRQAMKFKDLAIGAKFEFDHSHLPSWSGMMGPWTKRTARTYTHNESFQHYVVGTTSVTVKEVTS
jgi:hypothetical protein